MLPNQSTEQFCVEVCQRIAKEEKRLLDDIYCEPLSSLKECERVKLVQYAIGLPLLAQRYVQAAFADMGITYAHTAWKELSEELPLFSYVYIDWDISPLESPKSIRKEKTKKKETTKNVYLKSAVKPKSLSPSSIVQRIQKWKEGDYETEVNTQHKEMQRRETQNEIDEMTKRVKEARQRNRKQVDDWCDELSRLLARSMEKYQRVGNR